MAIELTTFIRPYTLPLNGDGLPLNPLDEVGGTLWRRWDSGHLLVFQVRRDTGEIWTSTISRGLVAATDTFDTFRLMKPLDVLYTGTVGAPWWWGSDWREIFFFQD